MPASRVSKRAQSHLGTQPIAVLQHNVVSIFESANKDFLELSRKLMLEGNLDVGIGYVISEKAITALVDGHMQMPFVSSKKKIHIHETFLSYVWCVSYSLWILYDKAVAEPSQNKHAGNEVNKIDNVRIDKAFELFAYAKSLIKVYTPWDKIDLPNPEEYSEDEAFYVERANSLFVYAMGFILYHEFAHVEKKHFERIKQGENTPKHRLAHEREADQRAIELMLQGAEGEKRTSMLLGTLIGLCCLLYFKKETTSQSHPDTDDRIHNYLLQLNLDENDPMWGIAAVAFRLWDIQFQKNLNLPTEVKNFKELYEEIRRQVLALK
ncbi:MAG: hypothetical protein JST90_15890 [Bacteroidetes bacterium]|nr:hypothetical protein [Bacteroidota bacterium]